MKMKLNKKYLSLVTTLIFSVNAHASVHCEDVQWWTEAYTGLGYRFPMSVHCTITNDSLTQKNYHVETHGWVTDPQSGSTMGGADQNYNYNLNPGQSITNNYDVNMYVSFNHTGYFRSQYEFKVSDGENFNKNWNGVISVPR